MLCQKLRRPGTDTSGTQGQENIFTLQNLVDYFVESFQFFYEYRVDLAPVSN
jgi:hypothetical protein